MNKIFEWFKKNFTSYKPEIKVSEPTKFTISGKDWLDIAFFDTIPTEEEVLERQMQKDQEAMYYKDYDDWYNNFLGQHPNCSRSEVYDAVKPYIAAYIKNSTAVYKDKTYSTELYWYKKESKTGLKNLLKKFGKNQILLHSIQEDEYRIIVKAAIIKTESK
jgi:hypothetical protein